MILKKELAEQSFICIQNGLSLQDVDIEIYREFCQWQMTFTVPECVIWVARRKAATLGL